MKRNALYLAAAVLGGLLLGYLIFGGGTDPVTADPAHGAEAHAGETFWTCSMHPQIMQPEPGSCPICGMDLIPAESGDQGLGPDQIRLSANAMALADIQTVRVGGETPEAEQTLRLSGKIEVNAQAISVQASFYDGRIEQLFVNYIGQQIRKGERLATLYSPGLIAAQQELLTAAPLKESQPALYRAVRNKLRNWKLTDTQIEQIEASGQVREAFPILSTVSGTVTEVLTAEGDYVSAGQPIARLSNLGSVWANLDAYERQVSRIRVGQPVRIVSNAHPDTEFQAKISFIDPILDAQTRTVTVRATLDNSQGLLKPGMFITGHLEGNKTAAEGPLQIPATAVLWTGERSLVYVRAVAGEPVFEMREVTLGNRMGDQYTVLEGLSVGEEIVAHGTFTVDAAAQLQGKKSMMNRSGSKAMETQPFGSAQILGDWPQALQKAYPALLDGYLALKDALVGSDSPGAMGAAHAMQTALPKAEAGWSDGLKTTLSGLSAHIEQFHKGGDTLEAQRAAFQQLSELMIRLGGAMSSAESPLYVQYCPMADSNKGAYWISRESEIRNPYFGDAMLTCGEVRATWGGPNN